MVGGGGTFRNWNIVFRSPDIAERHSHGRAIMYWMINGDVPSLLGPMDKGGLWYFIATKLPDGIAYDVDVEMTHVTADIIFRTILSQTLSGESAHKIFDAFTRFQELAPRIVNPVLFKLPRLFAPWLAIRRSNAAAGEIRKRLESLDAVYAGRWSQVDPLVSKGTATGVEPVAWTGPPSARWYSPEDLARAKTGV